MNVWLCGVLVLLGSFLNAQTLEGRVTTQGETAQHLNYVYVTNLREMQTGLTDAAGNFRIAARVGDVIRFSSYFHERRDYTVTQASLNAPVQIHLKLYYRTIPEVVIDFRPTGNLGQDVANLRSRDRTQQRKEQLRQAVGLPEPKGGDPVPAPIFGLNAGLALNIQSLYDELSGNRERQLRLQRFEKMSLAIDYVRNYFTPGYFAQLGIPPHRIDDFLRFVYASHPFDSVVKELKPERVRPLIERYLPIYKKRLSESEAQERILNQTR